MKIRLQRDGTVHRSGTVSSATLSIPLFPLKTVLFPSVKLELKIFEPRYSDMIANCMRNNSPFGVIHIYKGEETDSESEVFAIGTLANISSWQDRTDGLLGITAEGYQRFEIVTTDSQDDGLITAEVTYYDEDKLLATPEQYNYMPELLQHITAQEGKTIDDNPAFYLVLYQLIHFLPLDNTLKQHLLEVPKCIDRAVILHAELIRLGVIQYADKNK